MLFNFSFNHFITVITFIFYFIYITCGYNKDIIEKMQNIIKINAYNLYTNIIEL